MATEDFRYVQSNVAGPSTLLPLNSISSTKSLEWIPTVSAPVDFPLAAFYSAMEHTILHPEYSSSSILRADILDDAGELGEYAGCIMRDFGEEWHCIKRMRRRLVPKCPLLDDELLQECLLLENGESTDGMLVFLPELGRTEGEEKGGLDAEGRLPHYHPQVYALAIRYCTSTSAPTSSASIEYELDATAISTSIQIDLIPLPASTTTTEPASEIAGVSQRLYRTSLMLLKSSWKVSRGRVTGYEKRVNHDLLAKKESLQDLYREMKVRHRIVIDEISPRITFSWLLSNWHEDTDPKKHVFEDIAIAAWLILVWENLYGVDENGKGNGPPGGFVDVGCGNGLLVYILEQEGFRGYGVDLRRRKSWPSYPPSTILREQSLDPTTLLSSGTPPFPEGSFIIGNHADELTPWIPLFAAATPGSSFLNIPCCLHALSGRFTLQKYLIPSAFLDALPSLAPSTVDYSALPSTIAPTEPKSIPLLIPFYAPSPSQETGRYQAYQLYLAHLTLQAGFVPEREALRIPSTKNFGFLGRRRTWDGMSEEEVVLQKELVRCRVEELVEEVGEWTARIREGKLPLLGH